MNTLQWGDFYAKVPNAVASGAGPDVAAMHIDQLGHERRPARHHPARRDRVRTCELSEDDFAPVVWKAGVYKDKRYGIPLDVHPLGFYANTAHLEKAGIDEPAEGPRRASRPPSRRMQDKSAVEKPFWVTATWPAHLMFTSLIAQFGGSIYDDEGAKATFNSDAGVESLEWLLSFIDSGASPKNVVQRRAGAWPSASSATP